MTTSARHIVDEPMPSWAGAMLDHFDGKFNLLIDGYTGLDARITELGQRIDRLEKRMDELEKRIDDLERKMDYQFEIIFEKLGDLEKRILRLEQRLDLIQA